MASKDLNKKADVKVGLQPQKVAKATTVTGVPICTQGYVAVTFCVMSGSIKDGTFTFKLQHGLQPDGSDMEDVPSSDLLGALTIWTDLDSGRIQHVGYYCTKLYVRIVCIATGCPVNGLIAADVNLGNPLYSMNLATAPTSECATLVEAQ